MRIRCRILLLWLAGIAACFGCDCPNIPAVRDAWAAADMVFTGTVVEVVADRQEQRVLIRVDTSFKGTENGADVRLVQEQGSSCSRRFSAGEVFLFYLPPPTRSGARRVPPCGRTRLAAQADRNEEEFFGHLNRKERRDVQAVMQGIVTRLGLRTVPTE